MYRFTRPLRAAAALCAVAAICGCNQTRSGMFQNPTMANGATPTVTQPQQPGSPVTHPAAPVPQAAAPYVLSAKSTGAFIDFSIYNLGETDLPVKREDFAVISQENRDVVPYTREGTVIDLPQPAVVKPNDTLHGRAVFKAVKNPVGKRLVFKPDAIGTFADINRE